MLCKNCGAQLPEGARFCLMCAAPVEDAEAPASEPMESASLDAGSFDQVDEKNIAAAPADDTAAGEATDATDVTGTFRVIPAAKKLEEPLNVGAVPFVPMAPAPRQTYVPRRIAHPVNQSRPGTSSMRPNVKAPKMQEFSWPETSSWYNEPQVEEEPQPQKPKRGGLWSKLTSKPQRPVAEVPAVEAEPAPEQAPAAAPAAAAPEPAPAPSPQHKNVPEPPRIEEYPPVEPVYEDDFFDDEPIEEPLYPDSGFTAEDFNTQQDFGQFEYDGDPFAPDRTDNLHVPQTAARSYQHEGHVTNKHVLIVAGILAAIIVVAGVGVATGTLRLFNDRGKDYTENIRAEETPEETTQPTATTTKEDEKTETVQDTAVEGVVTKASVEDYTWEELSKISKAISAASSDDNGLRIAESYKLCDSKGKLDGTQVKEVELSDGTTIEMRIAGFRQDDLASGEGKAGITFIAAQSAGTKRIMEYEGSNSDWVNSSLREWMNTTLFSRLPDELADVIEDASKPDNAAYSTGKSQTTVADTLWIPSLSEIYGEIPSGYSRHSSYTPEGEQYALFADLGVTWGKASDALKIGGTTDKYWWTRTPDSESSEHNICVSTAGSDYSSHVITTDHSVVIGFCL